MIKKTIPSLNGLRTISILLVIAGHLNMYGFLKNFKSVLLVKYFVFNFNASFGVNVFFVISGFLITLLMLEEEKGEIKITKSLKNFYLRRIIRIFPAYYFLLFIYFLLNTIGFIKIDSRSWVYCISFARQFLATDDLTNHFWSLSVEELFYLFWPFVFYFMNKYRVRVLIFIIILTTINRYFQYDFPLKNLHLTIFNRADALLIGCLIAIYYEQLVQILNKYNGKILFIIFSLVSINILVGDYLDNHLDSLNTLSNRNLNTVAIIARIVYSLFGSVGLITNLLIGIVIVISINVRNIWFDFLNLKPIVFIGKLSYSLYLWQQLFFTDLNYFKQYPIYLLLLFVFTCAMFSYYVIEKPFLKFKRNFTV